MTVSRIRRSAERTTSALRIVTLASVVLPVVLFAVAAWLDYNDEVRQAVILISDDAAILCEHANRVLETDALVLDAANRGIEGMNWNQIATSPEVHRLLATAAGGHSQVRAITLVAPDGAAVASSYAFPMPAVDKSQSGYFDALRSRDLGLYVGPAYRDAVTGETVFDVAQRRTTADGRFDGVVVLSVDEAVLSGFWTTLMPELDHYTRLVRADGTILSVASEPASLARQTAISPDTPFFHAIRESDHGTYRGISSFDAQDRLVAYDRVGEHDLYVILGASMGSVLEPWYGDLRRYGAFAAVAAACLLLLCWLTLSRARGAHAIIEQLETEMNLRQKAEAALHESQKMEALGRLTGSIAHDFNNLLTVISGNLESLNPVRDPQAFERLRLNMSRAVERGGRLTQQLLAFARQQPLSPVLVDTTEHLRSFSDMIVRSLGNRIAATVDAPSGLWPILVDPHELDLALLNIAFNARDAMPDGGTLRLTARNAPAGDATVAALALDGDFVAIRLADSGTGMTKEVLARVFDPFFTTKEPGKGTGLGLSQVYGFAQQLGGAVSIDSTPGKGTVVTLYFPRARSEPLRTAAHAANPLVLVVEDDPAVAETADALLSQLGCRIERVTGGREALDRLAAEQPPADLLFSDIHMPGMNGIELAQEARRLNPRMPVLLTSGYTEHLRMAEHLGLRIVRKPYRLADLRQALADALPGRDLANTADGWAPP